MIYCEQCNNWTQEDFLHGLCGLIGIRTSWIWGCEKGEQSEEGL